MRSLGVGVGSLLVCLVTFGLPSRSVAVQDDISVLRSFQRLRESVGEQPGVAVLLGLPDEGAEPLVRLVETSPWLVYFHSDQASEVQQVRQLADQRGCLGRRLFADTGTYNNLPLTANVADGLWVADGVAERAVESELLRVLRPGGRAVIGDRLLAKGWPVGVDDWSHPYHRPDNNPQSEDQHARGEFLTQFVMEPKFSPMPKQTVIAGGRMFMAMGHIAHRTNQNLMLNTLLAINAFNGCQLWQRPLPEGFMIHRNTMIATDQRLYLGDDQACYLLDAATGRELQRIVVPEGLSDGPVWKWMGLADGVLYALVGNSEVKVATVRSDRRGLGHWSWGMWEGHDYRDPRTAFGHGRTLLAMDADTGELLWHHREEAFLDARAICMSHGRIYAYAPDAYFICVDAGTGELLWRNEDPEVLAAIGPNQAAQQYTTGYATTCYVKCTESLLLLAGPQRNQTVALSTEDGSLRWLHPEGNLQLVLRPDAIYGAGPQRTHGVKLDYGSGGVISTFPARRACTRATGSVDSIFFRATGGTVRIKTADLLAEHIAPMRPACQDGVLIAGGHLYWGPWMCGCELSLYGNIGLRPLDESRSEDESTAGSPLRLYFDAAERRPLHASVGDWPTYRGDNARSDQAAIELADRYVQAWSVPVLDGDLMTPPVTAGGYVFVADRIGRVHAYAGDGDHVWTAYTGGPIYYPPSVAHDALYVGSADGSVYAFEALTGRLLWRTQVASQLERIPLFGQLVSRHPVSGGVVVEGDRVYTAAGLTHYDGTWVVALSAQTGEPLMVNSHSGRLSDQVASGISLQGELAVRQGQLQFAGGGVYELATYDLASLQCLNPPKHQLHSEFRTAFYPWYPEYNRFVSYSHQRPDGSTVCFDANYDGSYFSDLGLQAPSPAKQNADSHKDLAGEFLRRRGQLPPIQLVWQESEKYRFTALVGCERQLLGSGFTEAAEQDPQLLAFDTELGEPKWKIALQSPTVKAGLAVDHRRWIFAALESGQLVAFRPAPGHP